MKSYFGIEISKPLSCETVSKKPCSSDSITVTYVSIATYGIRRVHEKPIIDRNPKLRYFSGKIPVPNDRIWWEEYL